MFSKKKQKQSGSGGRRNGEEPGVKGNQNKDILWGTPTIFNKRKKNEKKTLTIKMWVNE